MGGALSVSAVDTSSGSALTGVTLKAPAGASVVTPTTTLVSELGGSASAVADALGLSGVDLLSYNPYAEGVSATDATALAVEKIQTQIVTTVKAMAAAAEGQGVAAESAAATAFGSIATIVATKSAAAPLDFTNTADIDAVVTQASTDLSASITAAGGNAANFTTATNALKGAGGALKAVNDEIDNISDLSASGTTNILSAASRLAGQVKASSQAGNTTAVDNLKTNISALITEAGNNTAPSAITVTSPGWDKATQTFSSTLSATDAEGDSITYSLTGPDEKLFTVSGSTLASKIRLKIIIR